MSGYSFSTASSFDVDQLKIRTYLAAENLSALRLVRVNSSNQVVYADNTTNSKVIGLTITSSNTGDYVSVLLDGKISDPSWNWDITKKLFLGENGFITQTPPTNGFLIDVGSVITPTDIYIDIQEALQL